jgi:hypothetical protein
VAIGITATQEVDFRRELEKKFRAMFEDEVRHMQMQMRGVGTGPNVHTRDRPLHEYPVTADLNRIKRDWAAAPSLTPQDVAMPAPQYPTRSKLLLLLKGNP